MKKQQKQTMTSSKGKSSLKYPSFKTAEELIQYLEENVLLQNKMQFYSSLDIANLQNFMGISFRPNKLTKQRQMFVIHILKKHSFIASIALNNQKFNFNVLISFINENRVDYSLLNLLEDILLPMCRKIPHKILQILMKDKNIKQTFIKHIYLKHIYKILYTLVFCCQINYIQQCKAILSQIMNCMINSIFQSVNNNNSLSSSYGKKSLKWLSFGQITQNLKMFLSDLCTNLESVQFLLIEQFIQMLIKQDFITKSFQAFQKYKDQQSYEDFCQGIVLIHINMIKVEETFILSSNQSFNNEQKKHKKIIQNLLWEYSSKLQDKFQYLIDACIVQKTQKMNFSSGQKIQTVGLIRYRILELIEKLLNLSQITNLKIQYDKLNFIPFFQCFLSKFKWNNLVQILLLKIFETIISQDQNHFILKHLVQIQGSSYNFFGNLIVNFINKNFMFLHSLRKTSQGNRSILFMMCKFMIHEVQQKGEIGLLFKKVPFWKQFIQKDMKNYEQTHYEDSKLFNKKMEINSSQKKITRRQSISIQRHSKTLETIQQMLQNLKEADKWSPTEQKNISMKKNKLLEDQVFRQMDSLAQHQIIRR